MNRMFAAALATMAAPVMMGQAQPGSLTVNVSGIRNTNGTLIACIHRDKNGFPTCQKSATAIRQNLRISGSSMTVRFTNVKPGAYAVSIQHDEDGNGKLKTNFIGMPKEGVGVSNNPGGIPNWKKAQIQIGSGTTISVSMRYL